MNAKITAPSFIMHIDFHLRKLSKGISDCQSQKTLNHLNNQASQ